MKKDSLMEEFVAGIAGAVNDIREKVVEEGWFGRTVTTSSPEAGSSNAIDTWESYVQQAQRNAPAEKEEIAPGNDIDR